jgi:hypothetical protein
MPGDMRISMNTDTQDKLSAEMMKQHRFYAQQFAKSQSVEKLAIAFENIIKHSRGKEFACITETALLVTNVIYAIPVTAYAAEIINSLTEVISQFFGSARN